jgi:hypothetical protein
MNLIGLKKGNNILREYGMFLENNQISADAVCRCDTPY